MSNQPPAYSIAPRSGQQLSAPLVSIIVNCLNGEAYLAAALDSALAQSFKDWELILYDDQSTDGSAEIFRSYADPRFRYIYAKQRLELTQARDEAIRHSCGEWLAFLDQDDLWMPDKLERQLDFLRQPGADKVGLIYGRAKRFGYLDAGRDFDHHFEGQPLPEGDIFNRLAMEANFIPMSSSLVRRLALTEMDPVPQNIRLCPDYYYWMAISQRWQVRALQEPCCLYRVRSYDFTSYSGVQIFTELLDIIEYFSRELDPRTLVKRRRACENLIGIAEIASGRLLAGLNRIARYGSVLHLIARGPGYILRCLCDQLLHSKAKESG
ncbi:MAG: glycosyltransferase involved in cell wall biosynthesis [Porticoccaceae bacterium]|jgi:glycosyltransferase involved in cell wall biosynthesis